VHKLNAEQAASNEVDRLETEIRTATSALVSSRQASGHGLLDAQIDMIVDGTGLAEGKVRVALLFLVAFVMQLGAGFGVALGLAPLQVYLEEKKRAQLKKPTAGGHLIWGEAARVEENTASRLPERGPIAPNGKSIKRSVPVSNRRTRRE
jgi:hypothetical protein